MKEIKAYIKPELANDLMCEMELNKLDGMALINFSYIRSWTGPRISNPSKELFEKYCPGTKIDIICPDDELEKFVKIIFPKYDMTFDKDREILISDIAYA